MKTALKDGVAILVQFLVMLTILCVIMIVVSA